MDYMHYGLMVVVVLLFVYYMYHREHYYSQPQVEAVQRRERAYPFTVANGKIFTDQPYPYVPPSGAHQLVSDAEFDRLKITDDPQFRFAMPVDERPESQLYPPNSHYDDVFTSFLD